MHKLVKVPGKLALAPPTDYQLGELGRRLDQNLSLEHAAAFAGVPRHVIREWVAQGRAGNPKFYPFVELLDIKLAQQAAKLLRPITDAADDGNLKAAMWLYGLRVSPYEDRARRKEWELEDRISAAQEMVDVSQGDAETDAFAAELMDKLVADIPSAASAPTEDNVIDTTGSTTDG